MHRRQLMLGHVGRDILLCAKSVCVCEELPVFTATFENGVHSLHPPSLSTNGPWGQAKLSKVSVR